MGPSPRSMETYPTPGHACLPARKSRPGQRSRQRKLWPEHCGRTLRSHPLLPLGCEKDHPGPMEPKPLDGPKQVGGCRGCLVPPALGADALEMASLPLPPIPVPVLSQQVGLLLQGARASVAGSETKEAGGRWAPRGPLRWALLGPSWHGVQAGGSRGGGRPWPGGGLRAPPPEVGGGDAVQGRCRRRSRAKEWKCPRTPKRPGQKDRSHLF